MRIVWSDALATLALSPLILVAALLLLPLSIGLPSRWLNLVLDPIIVLVLIIALTDISTRESASGMTTLLYSVRLVRERFVLWKFCVSISIAALFLTVPFLRLLFVQPAQAASLLGGAFFLCAGATALGTMTGSSKPFLVAFLLFLSLVIQSPLVPALDFAGWNGLATNGIRFVYGLLGMAFLCSAEIQYRIRLRLS